MAKEELYMREWGNSLALFLPKGVWARANLYYGKGLLCNIGGRRFLSYVSLKGRGKAIRIPSNLVERAQWKHLVGDKVSVDLTPLDWDCSKVLPFKSADWAVALNPQLFPEGDGIRADMRKLGGVLREVGLLA